jgi:serine/threonine protein kinase
VKDESSRDGSVTAVDAGTVVSRSPQSISVGDVLAGRYEVRAIVGRGGMGLVVAARDRTLGIDVAIKLLRPELVGERRWAERLAREVKVARQLHHPNVCRVFDFVQADGRVFIVMELAKGTLAAEIGPAASAARSLEQRLRDVGAVVAGLAAIHEAKIVHRDVTAHNVLRLADGRLVVSDFGLATDAGETTASLQGGTVAYMAPELAVGGRASFASDVWALGIVIHEVVFGGRPTWRGEEARRGIERLRRKLTSTETAIFDVCRACTAASAADRPRDAMAVARLLERIAGFRARRFVRAAAILFVSAMAILGATWGIRAAYRRWGRDRPAAAAPSEPPIEITGEAEDWTESSRVLATVAGRIHCLAALPDQRTVRFVWGVPKRAEDVDIHTGARRASPLVPKAYAEGCPDLSPDGRELIFQGYDYDGHPGIFRASDPSGAGASFATSAANPSMLSEPRWFADGKAFVFDVDQRDFAVVDSDSGRPRVVPLPTPLSSGWSWRFVSRKSVYIISGSSDESQIRSVSWPGFNEGRTFSIRGVGPLWQADANDLFYAVDMAGSVILVRPERRVASRLGRVRDQWVWHLAPVGGGVAVSTVKTRTALLVRNAAGELKPLAVDGPFINTASPCKGDEYLVSQTISAETGVVSRVDGRGRSRKVLSGPPVFALCSPTGNEWWYVDLSLELPKLFLCTESNCQLIANDVRGQPSLSPDETRLAYVAFGNRGSHVRWMPSHGGQPHEVADTETNCRPGWSSNSTLWISRRLRGVIVWTEVDAETGTATGRTTPGGKDCADAEEDPLSPVDPDLRIVIERTSEVRWKDLR